MNTAISGISLPAPAGLRHDQSYSAVIDKLSEMSVRKAHDPFLDVPWDAPESVIEPGDARLAINPQHPLARTSWYEQLDAETQARFGAEWLSQQLRYATGFEAALSRGLLMFAQTLGNRAPEFRYVMHEVVEESRHSQMFQGLIARLGTDPQPVTAAERWIDDRVIGTSRWFPELFFLAVLGGEIFIDRQNREELRRPKAEVHPLVRRVMQIHVTEEARHVCFAEKYLQEHLPRLGAHKRAALKLITPILLVESPRKLLQPSAEIVKRFAIPPTTLREVFGPNTAYQSFLEAAVEPLRELAETHGFWSQAAWQRAGLARSEN